MEVLQRTANRGSISTDTGYNIDNSLKLEADNSEYLYYTSTTQTDYERMAFSLWIKRTELSTSQRIAEFGNGTSNTSNLRIGFDTSDRLFCYGNSIIFRQTNQVFRDTSAWYHLFFLFDTTTPGGISNNRIRIWVNGEMIPHTDFGVINNPGAGAAMGFNNGLQQSIGAQREDGPTGYFNGYMAQVYGSGGTPPVVGDFGETDDNGIWIPKDISELTPPDTQGFNLDFSDASNLGNDISSRNNDFTLQNITSADQATDTPTNNFATISVTAQYTNSFRIINQSNITNGATKITKTDVGAWGGGVGTMGVKSGKWYYEGKIYDIDDLMLGFSTFSGNIGANASPHGIGTNIVYYGGGASGSYWFYHVDGTATSNSSNRGTVWSVGDIIGIALDLDNSKVNFYVNGSLAGSNNTNVDISDVTNEINSTGDFLVPFTGMWRSTIEFNFGGYTVTSISSAESDENGYGTFEYAPPTGYYALCTKNLAEYG